MSGTTLFSPKTGDVPVSELGMNLIMAETQAEAQTIIGSGSGTGAVTSVNGETGAVVLTATDVGALADTTSIPVAGTATPVVAGTAVVGASTAYAREDHVHPAQTTITGNAGTATALATARSFSVSFAATASAASFTGAADAAIVAAYPSQLLTARTISVSFGSAAASASFNGSANAAITLLHGVAVTDTTDTTDVGVQLNALLASLRTAGVIASS